jgi:predicted nuclease with TOPRIM domain
MCYFVEAGMKREEMDEIKGHFDIVAEALSSNVRVVAEGHTLLREEILGLAGQVGRFEDRLDRFEGEVKAMLRISFADLEQRVRLLESTMGDLAGRVVRLESARR